MATTIEIRVDGKDAKEAVAALRKELGGLNKPAKEVNTSMISLNQTLEVVKKGFHATKAVLDLTIGTITRIVSATASVDEAMGDFASRTGATVETVSALTKVNEKFGGSMDQLDQGLKGLTLKITEANKGGAEAIRIFNQVGVSFQDSSGTMRPVIDVMRDISDRFATMPDGIKKSEVAIRLFEESGLNLIPFLNQGSTEIDRLSKQFEQIGATTTTAGSAIATEFNHNLRLLGIEVQSITQGLGRGLIPILNTLVVELKKFASSLASGIDWEGVNSSLKSMAISLLDLSPAFIAVTKVIVRWGETTAKISQGVVMSFNLVAEAKARVIKLFRENELAKGIMLGREDVIKFNREQIEALNAQIQGYTDMAARSLKARDAITKLSIDSQTALNNLTPILEKVKNQIAGGGSSAGGGGGGGGGSFAAGGSPVITGGGGGGGGGGDSIVTAIRAARKEMSMFGATTAHVLDGIIVKSFNAGDAVGGIARGGGPSGYSNTPSRSWMSGKDILYKSAAMTQQSGGSPESVAAASGGGGGFGGFGRGMSSRPFVVPEQQLRGLVGGGLISGHTAGSVGTGFASAGEIQHFNRMQASLPGVLKVHGMNQDLNAQRNANLKQSPEARAFTSIMNAVSEPVQRFAGAVTQAAEASVSAGSTFQQAAAVASSGGGRAAGGTRRAAAGSRAVSGLGNTTAGVFAAVTSGGFTTGLSASGRFGTPGSAGGRAAVTPAYGPGEWQRKYEVQKQTRDAAVRINNRTSVSV